MKKKWKGTSTWKDRVDVDKVWTMILRVESVNCPRSERDRMGTTHYYDGVTEIFPVKELMLDGVKVGITWEIEE